MLFLLIASVMILVAFLIVLPPLWRKQPVAEPDQDQRNIAIARQRLAELKEQLQTGALTQALYDEQLLELEQALSDDLDIGGSLESHVKAAETGGRWMATVLVLAIPFLAGSLYWTLGNYQSLTQADQAAAANQATPATSMDGGSAARLQEQSRQLEQFNKMVAGLAQRLEKQPDDALGWTMLGRSYKYLQQYPKAAAAFEHAYKLTGDQPEIMLLYAETMAFANNEQLAGKPAELVFKALAMEPDNTTGLWFGGMAKAQAGDFVAAMALWKKLESLLPQGSEAQQEIQSLLAKLATQIPEGAAQEQAKPAQPVKTASIDVQVSLAAELQKSASPEDTVFVYAQALTGSPMPLAIVRKKVADLPLTVSLNDAMAMMPTMKLSNFQQVKLLARISKSGNAMKQPGDLIGVIEQVAVTDKSPHKIIINSQVK